MCVAVVCWQKMAVVVIFSRIPSDYSTHKLSAYRLFLRSNTFIKKRTENENLEGKEIYICRWFDIESVLNIERSLVRTFIWWNFDNSIFIQIRGSSPGVSSDHLILSSILPSSFSINSPFGTSRCRKTKMRQCRKIHNMQKSRTTHITFMPLITTTQLWRWLFYFHSLRRIPAAWNVNSEAVTSVQKWICIRIRIHITNRTFTKTDGVRTMKSAETLYAARRASTW